MQPTPEPDLAADHAESDDTDNVPDPATEAETAGEADCEEKLGLEEADDTEADPADNADGSDGEAEHVEELDPAEAKRNEASATCEIDDEPDLPPWK